MGSERISGVEVTSFGYPPIIATVMMLASPLISPITYCAARYARRDGAYSLRPARHSVGCAFAALRCVRRATAASRTARDGRRRDKRARALDAGIQAGIRGSTGSAECRFLGCPCPTPDRLGGAYEWGHGYPAAWRSGAPWAATGVCAPHWGVTR